MIWQKKNPGNTQTGNYQWYNIFWKENEKKLQGLQLNEKVY